MQNFREIRQLLDQAHLSPRKQFGQNFLIDGNLMQKLLDLADLTGDETVLEVGPGTGSLTEELLGRAKRVIAVEIDRGMAELLRQRFAGQDNLLLLCTDILESKSKLSAEVLKLLPPTAILVSNLPYNITTPLVAQCLVDSWRARGQSQAGLTLFESMVFTVQQEVADRFASPCGVKNYGAVSVVIQLLGKITPGAALPASAFWPRPKVASRMLRIDFDHAGAADVENVTTLLGVLSIAFAQRRKQLGSLLRRKGMAFSADALAAAMTSAGIDTHLRAEGVSPEQFRLMANALDGAM